MTDPYAERRAVARAAYLEACELELRAFKPGNVGLHAEGHGMTVADFRLSAAASAPCLCDPALPLGERIFHAIAATRRVVACNTNLGIVLLAAPLILAFETQAPGEPLRRAVTRVLAGTTRADAEWVYRAIRLAEPGGLGQVPEQDVGSAPTASLQEVMGLAAGRDRIAYQYTNSFSDIFDHAIPSYHTALSRWGAEEWAAVAVFVSLLKRFPDSHVERKFGTRYTGMIAERMARLERALSESPEPKRVVGLLREVDTEFKRWGVNPGTTADLTVACLLAARLGGLPDLGRGNHVLPLPVKEFC